MNPKRASYSITRLLLVFTILGVALHASSQPAAPQCSSTLLARLEASTLEPR